MIKSIFGILLVSGIVAGVVQIAPAAEPLTATKLVERSIFYHDPSDVWSRGTIRIDVEVHYSPDFAESRGVEDVERTIWLSPATQTFRFVEHRGEDVIEYVLEQDEGRVSVNGTTGISEEDRVRLRLSEPESYRDYFEYLFGMPMKLRDPGTNLDPEVRRVQFQGRETWALHVTYDTEVGEDIWYFYFDPESYALAGYRFYHDEAQNDGEYIVLEGELRDEETGFRLPRSWSWHYNADGGHLATDEVMSIVVSEPDGSQY